MDNSFLNKLKKGMDIADQEEKTQASRPSSPPRKRIKEIPIEIESENSKPQPEPEPKPEPEEAPAPPPEKEEAPAPQPKAKAKKEETIKVRKESKQEWPEAEGQLAVDVYQTDDELVIQSAIAGVEPKDLDITIEGDLITIKGKRTKPSDEKGDYFYQECYWGEFSRQIILPVEVDPGRINAVLKEGILVIRIPKIMREGKMKVQVQQI
ncbi:MAG: Hsp20 family protein [Candidatus Nealsonbacteria bacterium]|nr:Hsp20 family protein [Candidatus Nealsonbacteria bacterium]